MQTGNISVQSENIFPIIKKFLYSDQEIFLRELIANAVDATTKLKTLSSKGEIKGDLGNLQIEIILDKEAKKLIIKDAGIGMTEEEVKTYLNQVAFSSASEFLEKYKDDAGIIGHFGLGFYSAFMVSDIVEVHTKSWKEGAAVKWTCDGNPTYTLEEIDKSDRGTEIVLNVSEDSIEFLEESRIQTLLDKYCKFLPVEIKFGTKTEQVEDPASTEEEKKTKEITVDNIINNPNPAWKRSPAELTDEDYKSFYNELYPYSQPPMFWIHLNIDFPFNLTGILYFPKVSQQIETQKNKIQLYCNQVFVTDEVKEIVPEFLTLLHGVIDSPDIPLNVSRSYLQSDSNVRKITGYITKKVADKLAELYKKERESFVAKWPDLGVFVKYGMITEEKFYEKAVKFALLKNTDGKYATIQEYIDQVKPVQTDKNNKTILLYTNDAGANATLIEAAKEKSYDVLIFDQMIDNHFLQQVESKFENISFSRIDADTLDQLIQKDENQESVLSDEDVEKVKITFELLTKEMQGATLVTKAMSPSEAPVVVTKPEFMRRMKEMQMMQGMDMGAMGDFYNVVINTNHPLITDKVLKASSEDDAKHLAEYLINLAKLSQQMLSGKDLANFVKASMERI
ncbi:MAG: molecular chaperone HtpG [Saprospiraceae bacterium]|nr:molecular chaperone HtpG [Saprospiraceae bacterium]